MYIQQRQTTRQQRQTRQQQDSNDKQQTHRTRAISVQHESKYRIRVAIVIVVSHAVLTFDKEDETVDAIVNRSCGHAGHVFFGGHND